MPADEYELKKAIKAGSAGVYILYGDETCLVRRYEQKISAATVKANRLFNSERFDGAVPVGQIRDSVMGMPFGDTKRYVSVCDLPIEKLPPEDFNMLCDLTADPVPTTVLVLWFETVDIPQGRQSARIKKLFDSVRQGGGTVACLQRKSTGELAKAVCAGAAKRGCSVSYETASYMVSVCGEDLFTLSNEIEKICAYSGGGNITAETIDKVCCRSVEASVYNISGALFKGDMRKALEITDDLFYMRTEPVVILSGIADSYIDICRVTAAKRAGISITDAKKTFEYGNRAFRLDMAAENARGFTEETLFDSMRCIAETDAKLKRSTEDRKTVLQVMLIALDGIRTGKLR